jgi:hypothetical protein
VWRNVLAASYPDRRVPYAPIASAYLAGMALNAFTPARGGDVAKLLLVRLQLPWSSVATLASSFSVLLLLDAVVAGGIVAALAFAGALPALPGVPGAAAAAAVGGAFLLAGVAGVLAVRMRPAEARRVLAHLRLGIAILAAPRRYVTTVLPFQLAAWAARIGVVALVLAAFRVDASLGTAALLVVLNGLSTAVAVPGGAGSQQLLAAYALQRAAPVAGAVTFSVGLQLGVTVVNTAAGMLALMLIFRVRSPLAAVRASRVLGRARVG